MFRTVAVALALALTAASVLGLPSRAEAQESTPQVILRLHQMLPPQAAIPARALIPWIETVERESQGRIKVEHYPSMQLGGAPPSLYDQARDGVVDLIWTVLGYTPGRFPKSEAFELPFMVTTAEATSRAFHEYALANAMDE
ncbi:MAG: C4-dicarboxylate ABC transporter, partial [Kiloniellaceae bacterium]